MDWNFRNDLPIYSQLIEQIKLAIVSGVFPPGERLSSVRDMAAEAGVNPNTLQRALQELERQGLVYSQRTAGRFVTEDVRTIESCKRALARAQLTGFCEKMKQLGYERAEIIALLEEEA
jgi:DNA-binding transcriptional regulator YhcF (GntR family)